MIISAAVLGKQIERVAIEYNQMQHLVGRAKGLPFMTDNEWVNQSKKLKKNVLTRDTLAYHTHQRHATDQIIQNNDSRLETITATRRQYYLDGSNEAIIDAVFAYLCID